MDYLEEGRRWYAKGGYDRAVVAYNKFIDLKPLAQVGYHERAARGWGRRITTGPYTTLMMRVSRNPKSAWAGCDLRLMSSVNEVSGIPAAGKSLIILAVVDQVLHFRIFDDDGDVVEDVDEKRLTDQAAADRRSQDATREFVASP